MPLLKGRRSWVAVVFALMFFGSFSSLYADIVPTLFGTGVDASGNPLPNGSVDPHYTAGGPLYTIGSPGSVGWVDNTLTSSWVSPVPNTLAGPGPFTYHTTFDLTGFLASTAQITGQLAADDQATIYLNGVDVFDGAPDNTAPWSFLQALTISSGFISGINTLDIYIPNNIEGSNDGPTGLQLNLTGTATPVPEPASVALLGLSVFALNFLRRRA